MTRTTIKQTLIDHGVTEVSGALLDALSASGNDVLREALTRISNFGRHNEEFASDRAVWQRMASIASDALGAALSTTPTSHEGTEG